MTSEEAISAIKARCSYCEFFPVCVNDKPECFCAMEMAITALSSPSAERKGEWISYINDGFVECPFCGSLTNCDSTEEMDTLHYCFNCGARMVENVCD